MPAAGNIVKKGVAGSILTLPFSGEARPAPRAGSEKRGSAMKLPQTGGCQCRAIRYEIRKAPQLVYTCHCTECQRLTGSAFSMALVVAADASDSTGTQPRPFFRTADSGHRVTRWVCPICGTWIWSGRKPEPAAGEAPSASGPAHWTTHRGYARLCISGPAASSPGWYCRKGIRGSRPSRKTSLGCEPARRNDQGSRDLPPVGTLLDPSHQRECAAH